MKKLAVVLLVLSVIIGFLIYLESQRGPQEFSDVFFGSLLNCAPVELDNTSVTLQTAFS